MKFIVASLLATLSLASASLRGVVIASSPSDPSIKTTGLAASPPNTYAASVVPFGDFRAFRFGGYIPSSGNYEKRADVYDAYTGAWSESIADMPVAMSSVGGAEYAGDLYLFGGTTGYGPTYSSDVYRFDIAGNSYTKLAPMQTAVPKVKVVNVSGKFFYGGYQTEKIWTYDAQLNQHSEWMFNPTGENPYCMAAGFDNISILWMGKNALYSINTITMATSTVAKFPFGDLQIPYTVDCEVKSDGTMVMVDGYAKAVYSINVGNVHNDFAGAAFTKVGKVPDYHDKGLSFNLIAGEVIVASMAHTDWVAQVPMVAEQM